MTPGVLFTTSWDDGHPLDLKVADLLAKHGCTGTFYLPCRNRQGRPVLSKSEQRVLDQSNEIGSHTLDHCYLTTVDPAEARRQIVEGKNELEDAIGHLVPGFCYPGGKYNRSVRQLVDEAGFTYARTVEGLSLDLGDDRLQMPTTLQFYPHRISAYARNFAKRGHWLSQIGTFAGVVACRDFPGRLAMLLDTACLNGGVLHIWGHSWEIEELGYWRLLAEFLERVADRIPPESRVTNLSAYQVVARQSGDGLLGAPSTSVQTALQSRKGLE